MPEAARRISAKQVALLHVAKRDLQIEDDDWRALLRQCGHVESSKDLSPAGCEVMLYRLRELGFRQKRAKGNYGDRPGFASGRQVAYARRLWRAFHGKADDGDVALNVWLERFHKVSALRFVDDEKITAVLSALRAMVARAKKVD